MVLRIEPGPPHVGLSALPFPPCRPSCGLLVRSLAYLLPRVPLCFPCLQALQCLSGLSSLASLATLAPGQWHPQHQSHQQAEPQQHQQQQAEPQQPGWDGWGQGSQAGSTQSSPWEQGQSSENPWPHAQAPLSPTAPAQASFSPPQSPAPDMCSPLFSPLALQHRGKDEFSQAALTFAVWPLPPELQQPYTPQPQQSVTVHKLGSDLVSPWGKQHGPIYAAQTSPIPATATAQATAPQPAPGSPHPAPMGT